MKKNRSAIVSKLKAYRAFALKGMLAAVVAIPMMLPANFSKAEDGVQVADVFSIFEPSDEKEIGAKQHKNIVAQYGGEYIREGLNDYVLDIVLRIVSVTEQRNEPWRATVLNSPVVNAFALPGGYVYVTRGLLALANNEAEVAGVLAHEVGHVIARHGVQRQSRATGIGLLGAIAGILTQSADVARLGQTMGGLFLADYSRDQEYEADAIGVKLLGKAGYPREAMADFLGRLDDHSVYARKLAGKDGKSGQYDFFASHPQTEDRIDRARDLARKNQDDLDRSYGTKRYLENINGMLYGDDIREGVIRGRQFLHPDLRLAFMAPRGFQLINSTRAVFARDGKGNQMTFDLDPRGLQGLSPAQYMSQKWMRKMNHGPVRNIQVGGAAAAKTQFMVNQNGRKAHFTAVVINFGYDKVARFVYRSRQRTSDLENRYLESYSSFRPMAYSEASEIRPTILAIRAVEYRQRIADLKQDMIDFKHQDDLFLLMNPSFKSRAPRHGEWYKSIEYAERAD